MVPERTAPASGQDLKPSEPEFATIQPNVHDFGIGPFWGAGRRRDPSLSAAARSRRTDASTVADKLVLGGLSEREVYLAPDGIGDTALSLDGSGLADWFGRPRRFWGGFADCAHALKAKSGREYDKFCEEADIQDVVQVVIRPPEPTIHLVDLAERHSAVSKTLGAMLRHARRSRAPKLAWDIIAAEFANVGDEGWRIDFHFHVIVRGVSRDELGAVQRYFEDERRGWRFWFAETETFDSDHHPIALAQYAAKGLADAIGDGSGWSPTALVEFRRQTYGLALVRACGAFRRWKSDVAKAGLTVAEGNDGRLLLMSRRRAAASFRRKHRTSTATTALRLCVHDFGDGLIRRSIRVRGPMAISLTDIRAAYDIEWLLSSYKENTAIPESLPDKSTVGTITNPLISPKPG